MIAEIQMPANKTLIAEIIAKLTSIYGVKKLPAKRITPLDELIFTILSQNTNDVNRDRAYANLLRLYSTWDAVLAADPEQIESAIRVGGLSHQKSLRIHHILGEIKQQHGSLSLDFLQSWEMERIHNYLIQLKGVGEKTVACVLLFSLGMPALPVDTHVHRVTQRLGLVPTGIDEKKTMELLLAQVPPSDRYAFHVLIIQHGRTTCHARKPECPQCVLLSICLFGKKLPNQF
jgi:endonuclease III